MDTRIRLSVSRLVDGLGGSVPSNAALLIEGDRIAEVGVEANVPRPEDCLALTFPDATALPGLIDAHVHLTVSWEPTREGTIERYGGETDGDLVARAAATAERMLRVGVTSAFSCGERGATGFAIPARRMVAVAVARRRGDA